MGFKYLFFIRIILTKSLAAMTMISSSAVLTATFGTDAEP